MLELARRRDPSSRDARSGLACLSDARLLDREKVEPEQQARLQEDPERSGCAV